MAIRKLPGVGPKMAERMALYLLRSPDTDGILEAVRAAKEHLSRCSLCGIYTEADPCLRCVDRRRDNHLLCVIEEMSDLVAMERSGAFRGQYHILGGVLSPLDGVGPRDLRIEPLLKRLRNDDPRFEEVIIATNP